ncbi:heavy-metal-associated domain-containing protein [Streptomyces sp. DSM 42041]|uniref:Heavy-metal-associated domain-containing protein n=1 Tax=Streptomyces hazeniae TaxID=3075538 RepID=A0ABU2NYS5_9ACTN|nr:heavy-metal-associated domain-containing protein [Streptomyces sp. DSM 42041]MDT0382134.1 heavy-metal-associated domain-containing protein [Streptomyces sp. DSM 42041]
MSDCCTPDGSCSTSNGEATTAVADAQKTVYRVSGMSCGHCKSTLTAALGELEVVQSVEVDVDAGQVTVTTGGAPDDALIAEIVDDAGYELTGRA